ncbi:MAG: hypothetical protein KGZ97_10040 [Bacteroidetes bacterium]|nr:hypothetical protein [Bacteroidota bacterium]
MIKKALFTVLILLPFLSVAQNTFTRDNVQFFQEIKNLFSAVERNEKVKLDALVDSFGEVWKYGNLMDEQKEMIYNTMDAMLGLRLRAPIDYPLYINTVMAVLKTKHARHNFEEWHNSIKPLLTLRNQSRYLRHLEYSFKIFKDNLVFDSPTLSWKYSNNNYILHFINDTLRVDFQDGNLYCYAQRDSLIIHNTKGSLFPFDEAWKGKGGLVTWERVELDRKNVYANLSSYNINLKLARYDADSVHFYNKKFFDTPLHGKLSERIVADVKPENARYPKFQSYQVVHEIRNIFPEVNYVGGFTMEGQRVLGSGTADGNAYIHFFENDSLFITVGAKAFSIRDDRISADRSSVSIYYSGDSIYHPNIQMRYLHERKEFYLLRDEKGISRAPFMNTYHNIDMYCEALYWYKGSKEILFQAVRGFSGPKRAVFESHNFFSDMLFMRMQGIADMNPLFHLRNYARDKNTQTFHVEDFSRYIRSNVPSTKAMLLDMSHHGFLVYDLDYDMITINDKLYHYLGAATGRSDFDVIRIESEALVNARINLLNFDLHIQGISRIPLSSSKNVVLHPFGSTVVMQKNRNMYFNGRIESGLFDFFGKEFFFNYEAFKIDLINTDSLSFRVKSFQPDSRGIHSYVRVRTVLEGINGELLIDNPKNKSGRLPIPRYPIFNSNNESFVYYDKEFVHSGTYRRADVYFKLVPFTVDSLDHATTDNIAFDGVFISTGIFPDFRDYLKVQRDYSLGFNSKTPEEGYPIYNGKAHYYGPIDMSYEGLMANGKMEYLNATMQANKMIMFLDSARADLKTFALAEQLEPVEYPDVSAKDVKMLFLPYQDELAISETKEPIELYAGMTQLRGKLSITPVGLTGSGKMDLFGSELSADYMAFKAKTFDSPNADFKIYTADGKRVAFNAFNYSGHFNLEVFTGVLDENETGGKISFPENRFDGYGYNFDWDMKKQSLSLTSVVAPDPEEIANMSTDQIIDLDFRGKELISTHRAQDSLRFFAGKIDFTVAENVINASEVNVVKVADAAIFPKDGLVSVLLRAEIKKLEDARIVANTKDRYHYFYNVTADIISRNKYRGSGKYDYVDITAEKQQIYFDEIDVIPGSNTTFAKGKILEDQDFTLSPRFAYKGDVELTASEKHMRFIGSTKIFVNCTPMVTNWFKFDNVINPDNVLIPVTENLKSDMNVDLKSALILAGDSFHIYPAFFDRRRHYLDKEIVSATGYLTWDDLSKEYQLSSLERLRNRNMPDNFIRLNPQTCLLEGEGVVDIGSDFGQLKTKSYGTVTHNIKEFKTDYDIVLGIDFYFIDSGMDFIAGVIEKEQKLSRINLNRQKYLKAYRIKTGEIQAAVLREEIIQSGVIRRVPPELTHTVYLADLKLSWNQRTTSFVSKGAIGVGNINKIPLNKYVNGYFHIRKQRGGDIISFILEPVTHGGKPLEISEEDVIEIDENGLAEQDSLYVETPDVADSDENDKKSNTDEMPEITEEVAEAESNISQDKPNLQPLDQLLGAEYFYFSYSNSIMQIIGANPQFNKFISDLDPKKRRMDVPSGETPFAFLLSTERRPFDFVRMIQRIND